MAAAPEIPRLDLSHILNGQQVRDAADLLELAAMEDRDAVADVLHVGQQVAGEDDRLALLAQVADQLLDLRGADRVEPRRRLVEQESARGC